MQELTALGYPNTSLSSEQISDTVSRTIDDMHKKYTIKHAEIIKKIEALKSLLSQQQSWWNQHVSMQAARQNFDDFISNIEHNFGEHASGYEFINTQDNINHYQQLIVDAISGYTDDMKNWQTILDTNIDDMNTTA